MTKALLLSYQLEYEANEDMTIDHLCEKYNITTKDLPGYTKWKHNTSKKDPITLPQKPQPITPTLVPQSPNEAPPTIAQDIEEFKSLAVKKALRFIKDEADYATVKEFKDIVSVVDSIDKSYGPEESTEPQINILINNITSRFVDDC